MSGKAFSGTMGGRNAWRGGNRNEGTINCSSTVLKERIEFGIISDFWWNGTEVCIAGGWVLDILAFDMVDGIQYMMKVTGNSLSRVLEPFR